MFIGDLNNKDEVHNLVVAELRGYGIKFRKNDKKPKIEKIGKKRIFKVPLHNLELVDCVIGCSIQQIPAFVADSCSRILEHVTTEGLFRKAGSTNRQREIKDFIESGGKFNKSHHVIDVANLLKTFIRDLPEPLLPPGNVQECLLKTLCLASVDKETKLKALLMTLLMLPPLTLNTLTYFLQFLQKVAQHADKNKMPKENLAIIIAPNIMPISEMIQQRLAGHVKVIELLIEHAHQIGIIPDIMMTRLEESFKNLPQSTLVSGSSSTILGTDKKKKKKRRSGSLTRMFNGFRKIVGAIGSSESLDKSPERDLHSATPCLNKSAKKRKVEPLNPFSAKKRKDVLSLLPEADSLILPNTPRVATIKKSRLSLGGRKVPKILQTSEATTSQQQPLERRWSVAWHRKKNPSKDDVKVALSPVVSMPCLAELEKVNDQPFSGDFPQLGDSFGINSTTSTFRENEEFVKIPKSEYESIKERVSAIETRISHEFGQTAQQSLFIADSSTETLEHSHDAESVQNKYERTLEKMEGSNSTSTDHLAKRLSRELKIRRSAEHKVIRSPSARKIGTMRRRSRELTTRLSRNQSWHLGAKPIVDKIIQPNLLPMDPFYPKATATNLKRGKPNTLQTGLVRYPSPVKNVKKLGDVISTPQQLKDSPFSNQWTAAEDFFSKNCDVELDAVMELEFDESALVESKPTTPRRTSSRLSSARSAKSTTTTAVVHQPPKTPFYTTTIKVGDQTPMLPPSIPPRRTPARTPMLPPKTPGGSTANSAHKMLLAQKPWLTPLQDNTTGRPSIAKLRNLNAGMVLAKAKLFNNMEAAVNSSGEIAKDHANIQRRQSTKFVSRNLQNNARLKTFLEGTNDSEMNGGDVRHLHKALRKIRESTNVNSPNRKSGSPRKRYLASKSPHSISRRNKIRATKSPTALKGKVVTVISEDDDYEDEENFIKSRKLQQPPYFSERKQIELNQPVHETPKIKKPLLVSQQPKKVMGSAQKLTPGRESRGKSHQKTPLKAIRHSPRVVRTSGGATSKRPY